MTWPSTIQSNTPARYRFKLVSETDELICNPEPIEWESGTLQIKRDLDWGGVFSTFQLDSLTFVGNAADMLRNLFSAYELNAKCTLVVYWWRQSDRTYVEFPSRFDINFNFYEIVKVGNFHFGVRVKAINNSVQTKLDNRMEVDVDITKRKSIGGFEIAGYGVNDANLKKILTYPQINVNYVASLPHKVGQFGLYHIAHKISYTSIPLINNFSDFPEVQSVEYFSNIQNLTLIPSFFRQSRSTRTLSIGYMFSMRVTDRYVGSFPWNVQILETKESLGVTTIVNTYDLAGFGGEEYSYIIDGVEIVTVAEGNDLKFVVQSPGIDAHYMAYTDFIEMPNLGINTRVSIIEEVANTFETITEGVPIYEALERTCQHVLDKQYPIYSIHFGRTDTIWNAQNSVYGSENQLRFAHIQTGLNQRGIKLFDADSSVALNFKKLMQCFKATYNIGYGLQTIDGELRIRIEQYAFFFENVEVLDLSARLNKYDIQSQVMPELVPVELKSGFETFEYLTVNGRGEPNTVNQRTSIMNTATKWENISPYRGDTKGIIDNISSPVTAEEGSTDTKADSSIFIVKTQRDPSDSTKWIPETSENITIVDNTSVFKESLMNRLYTPSRILYRHGNILRAGLSKFLTSLLTFQKTDKSSSLKTSGEGIDNLTERDDILVSTLAEPLYKAMKHTVEVEFTFSDLALLQQYPYRYITLSDNISGYLLTLKKKNNEDKAEITIIEKS